MNKFIPAGRGRGVGAQDPTNARRARGMRGGGAGECRDDVRMCWDGQGCGLTSMDRAVGKVTWYADRAGRVWGRRTPPRRAGPEE